MRFLLLLLLGVTSKAFSYPENIRHGYPSCVSCHVSPVGGGMLTPYGRGSCEAFISTWSVEHEGDFGYGAVALPSWLGLGGDLRGVALLNQNPRTRTIESRWIPMQADGEIALTLVPGLTLDGSAGIYGPDHDGQYRRLYAKVDLTTGLSLRAGRFLPAYGINLPDHTVWTRRDLGFGEGAETNNLEAAWLTRYGENILTLIYGADTALLTGAQGYDYRTRQGAGWAYRGALYLGSATQVGVSRQDVEGAEARRSYGGFVQTGLTSHGYLLGEVDRRQDGATIGFAKAGWEIAQGLMMTIQQDIEDVTYQTRLGIQWWPRPHWELLGEARRSYRDGGTTTGVLMLHHYL